MIKGVNRKVIEINHPESAYFERAVLYLRPDVNEAPLHAAQLETEAFLGSAHTQKRKPRLTLRSWVWFVLGMAVSGGVTAAILLLR